MTSKEIEKREILELLKDNNVTSIVLHGEQGVGKTWMAREISDSCKTEGLTHRTLWVYLNKKYDKWTLLETIMRQLSLLSNEEFEDDEEEEKEETWEKLKLRISAMLDEEASAMQKKSGLAENQHKRFFLLILDDVFHEDEKDIVSDLQPQGPNEHNFIKVLMTIQLPTGGLKNEIESGNRRLYHIKSLSLDESKKLLMERTGDFPQLGQHIAAITNEISKGIPATIIIIADALKYLQKHDSEAFLLESVLEEAGNNGKEADYTTRLLCCWYDEYAKFYRRVMILCFWHSMQHFHTHGGVHYNELITRWILEGYFGCFDQIQKAYEQGHEVLMDLIDCGMLSKQEDNIVIMNQAISCITRHRHSVFNETASLGLPIVFNDKHDKWKGLGRITQTSGIRKPLHSCKNWGKVSTLLMDGSFLTREVPETFFQPMKALQVFAIFNPLFSSLPLPLSSLENLVVMVLRGCDLLEKIDDIRKLINLCVLEISGAASLNSIPPDLFENLPNLQGLNLSASKIKSLPPSLFNRSKLQWLILRQCDCLETLPSLKALENLEVIDLSGADSLTKIHDKNFAPLRKLQMLDLSKSKIDRLPFLHNLENLTGLLLSGCSSLKRLPNLKSLSGLQILDVSNAINLVEIHDDSLDKKVDLQIVDLSGTAITQLPSNISNLSCLYLKDCSSLERFPSTKAFKNLKKLELSGSSALHEIEDKSFEHLRYLQILNFSRTKIKELPSLSNLGNLLEIFLTNCSNLLKFPNLDGLKRLKKLNLSGCVELVELPSLSALEKLEDLNLSETKIEVLPTLCKPSNLRHLILQNCNGLKRLSPLEHLLKLEELVLCGASSLEGTEAQFLEGMRHLQILDLSGTPLKTLPSLSNLIDLRKLTLRGCSGLNTVPGMEALTKLEDIDLCGMAIEWLPSLDIYCSLRRLLLKDCSNLEELQCLNSLTHLEVLDLSGTRIKKFPYEISELTCLERLDLPDLKDVLEIDLGKIKYLPEELNWDQCGIFKYTEKLVMKCEKPTIFVRGTKIFQCLEKNPELWKTYFKQFHFFVGHLKKQGEDGDINFCKEGLFFRDVYFRTRYFCLPEEDVQLLEIHGSYIIPSGFESVLEHTKYLSLVDNKSISHLSDLGADNVSQMRGCWIERCTKMESILDGEEVDIRLGRNLEILWVSNLPSLKNLYSGTEGFKNLKHLYLDCCPMIINVFSSSQFPENLEILHVKFCDKLATLFECGTVEGHKLQKLKMLYLFELPELRSIGIKLALQPTIRACPKLVL